MKLEQAIQQSSFISDENKVAINFMYTYNNFKENHNNFFKPFAITPQQYNVLRILRGSYPKPLTTFQLRDRMLDKMSDASRIVERLVKKDLVVRKVSKSDKRLVDVVISDAGQKLLESIEIPQDNRIREVFKNFSADDTAIFGKLLDKMRQD
jgi:MarR family 2-MHQ and catechol resistance regulon transcriptional repressor